MCSRVSRLPNEKKAVRVTKRGKKERPIYLWVIPKRPLHRTDNRNIDAQS